MEIPPPEVLKKPLIVPKKILMGPGPSSASPRVLQAMSHSVLGHMHSETFQIMDEIKEGIKYVFQTRNELTLAITASGHSGMEAVMSNLIESGDPVLICVNGLWGLRAADMAERYGGVVTKFEKKSGRYLSSPRNRTFPFEIEAKTTFRLGEICHRYKCLLAVDVVASVGGVPFLMDKWGVDVAYAGVQKVLGVPPGLTIISFSPKAQKAIFERKSLGKVYYWDMTILGRQWNCYKNVRPYHHTVSSNLLYALREGLAIMSEEGLENVIKRHEECYEMLRKGIEDLVLVDKEINCKDVISYAMKKYNLEISLGLGPTGGGNVLRIGLMGYNARAEIVDFTLKPCQSHQMDFFN
ncbi:hypothetical protein JTB14_017682 [Gonioctena quinquepunctata]|nr:hypothetical protein JTB14_017682 [Gonioctena quinquepunctata]